MSGMRDESQHEELGLCPQSSASFHPTIQPLSIDVVDECVTRITPSWHQRTPPAHLPHALKQVELPVLFRSPDTMRCDTCVKPFTNIHVMGLASAFCVYR